MKNLKTASIIAAAMALSAVLTSCGKTSIDLNDYIVAEYSGYDTMATLEYNLDVDSMISDNPEAFGLEDNYDILDYAGVFDNICDTLEGEADKTEGLSNGDKIKISWDKSSIKDLEEKYPVKLSASTYSIKVEGLEEIQEIDLFEYVSVSFSGMAPNATVSVTASKNLPVTGLTFTADKMNALSNGDVITVAASAYSDEAAEHCLKQGYKPEKTEMQFTVADLPYYAGTLADIPKESMDKMDAHAQETLRAHVAEKWVDAEGLKNIEFLGNYFLVPKGASFGTNTNNYVYLVYKITATNPNSAEPFSYYYYSYYTDVVILEDGTCSVDLSEIEVPEGSAFFSMVTGEAFKKGDYYYIGYEDLDSLFSKQVTAKIDSYTYESTVE